MLEGIHDYLRDIGSRHPQLAADDLFLTWFLSAYLSGTEESAVECLTGASGDKGIDAVYIDDKSRKAYVIQGKYRRKPSAEPRNTVLAFAQLAASLKSDSASFKDFSRGIHASV